MRPNGATWVVSPAACLTIVVGIVFAVFVVRAGDSEQHSRRIPAPRSAVVTVIHAGRVDGVPTPLDPVEAVRLATFVDRLPHRSLSQTHCGAETGSLDRIVFSTAFGPVVVSVDLGGCLGVDVASPGSDWSVDNWDPDAVLKSAITADVGFVPSN